MYNGGEIVIVKNIVFNDNRADHASIWGRPCIILSDFNNKLTMYPLSSSAPISSKTKLITATINKSDLEKVKKFKPKEKSYINLHSMIQEELRYYDIVAYLKMKRYYELLCEIESKRLENNKYCGDFYKDIYQDLEYQRNKLKLVLKR